MFLLLKCQQTLKLRTHFEYALDFAPDLSTPYKTDEESGWGGGLQVHKCAREQNFCPIYDFYLFASNSF